MFGLIKRAMDEKSKGKAAGGKKAAASTASTSASSKSAPKRRKRDMSDIFSNIDDLFAQPAAATKSGGNDDDSSEEEEEQTLDQLMRAQQQRDATAARQRQMQAALEQQRQQQANPLTIVFGGNASRGVAPGGKSSAPAGSIKTAPAERNPFALDNNVDDDDSSRTASAPSRQRSSGGPSELAMHHRRQEDAVERLIFSVKLFTNALAEHDAERSSSASSQNDAFGLVRRSSSSPGSGSVSSPLGGALLAGVKRRVGSWSGDSQQQQQQQQQQITAVPAEMRGRLLRLLHGVVSLIEAESVVLRWAHRSGSAHALVESLCSALARHAPFWVHRAGFSANESTAFQAAVVALLTALAHGVATVPAATESFFAAAMLGVNSFVVGAPAAESQNTLSKPAADDDGSDEDACLGELLVRRNSASAASTMPARKAPAPSVFAVDAGEGDEPRGRGVLLAANKQTRSSAPHLAGKDNAHDIVDASRGGAVGAAALLNKACALLGRFLETTEWRGSSLKSTSAQEADGVEDGGSKNDDDEDDADAQADVATRLLAVGDEWDAASIAFVCRFVACISSRALVHAILSGNVAASVTGQRLDAPRSKQQQQQHPAEANSAFDRSVPGLFMRQDGWQRCATVLADALDGEGADSAVAAWDPVVSLSTLVEIIVSDPSAATFMELRWLGARAGVVKLARCCFRLLLADLESLAAQHAESVLASAATSQAPTPVAPKTAAAKKRQQQQSRAASSSQTAAHGQQMRRRCELRLNRAQALLRCLMNLSRVAPLASALDPAEDFPLVREAFLLCLRFFRSGGDGAGEQAGAAPFVDLFSLCACCATALLMPPRADKQMLVHNALRNTLLGSDLELEMTAGENGNEDDDDATTPLGSQEGVLAATAAKHSLARIAASAMFTLRHGRTEVGRNVAAAYAAALLAALSLGDPKGAARMTVLRCLVAAARQHGASNQLGSAPMAYVVAVLQEFILFQSSHHLLTVESLRGLHSLIQRAMVENGIEHSAEE